jgi:tryptophan-rich sensory protein
LKPLMPTTDARRSLICHLLVVVGTVLLVNGLIFGMGWNSSRAEAPLETLPPGWVIGSVWVVLFTLFAVALWQLRTHPAAYNWLIALILFCLAYPFYSLAFDNRYAGLLGNLGCIALGGLVTGRALSASRPAALCIFPVIPWVIYATVGIVQVRG